jgi:hypothetical protein
MEEGSLLLRDSRGNWPPLQQLQFVQLPIFFPVQQQRRLGLFALPQSALPHHQLYRQLLAISLHRNYILRSKPFDRLGLRKRVQQPVLLFLLAPPILWFRLVSQQLRDSLL